MAKTTPTAAEETATAAMLPPPEVDILKTSHFNVLLHNQMTIIRQQQDIRRTLDDLLRGQRKAKGLTTQAEKKAEVDIDEEFEEALVKASKKYLEVGGEMRKSKTRTTGKAVENLVEAVNKELDEAQMEMLAALSEREKTSLHITISGKIKMQTKRKATDKDLGTPAAGAGEEEEFGKEGEDENIDEPPSKRLKTRKDRKGFTPVADTEDDNENEDEDEDEEE